MKNHDCTVKNFQIISVLHENRFYDDEDLAQEKLNGKKI
jgi:hypothetical protein